MVVRFADLGVPDPKGWTRSMGRVYDYNTNAGSFYYQPMLEYIERKQFTGEDCASMAARKASVATRNVVELPNACDFSRRTADDVPSASIRLEDFVNKYTAKQMKQRNTTTIHTKNELVRGSKSSQTLNDKQVSTMIRDRYLDQLAFYKHIGVGKTPEAFEEINYKIDRLHRIL